MKTIRAIVDLAQSVPAGEKLAMATVVKIRGSAYRRPGARMLLTADERTAGMISGGCLENDARERCREVMRSGEAKLVTYDSTAPEDIVFGLGLGCNGIVQVLLEPLVAGDPRGLLAFLSMCVARRQVGRVATVFQSDHLPLGARLLRWPDGSVTASFADATLSATLAAALQQDASRRTAIRQLDLANGTPAEVLVEAIRPPVSLTIFGAADDAIPLVTLAKQVGWHITVIDARPAYATPSRFPDADAVLCLRPEMIDASPQVVLPRDSLAMVMTHNFTHDEVLLRTLLPQPLAYLGVLGPKSRTQRLLDALAATGKHFPDDLQTKLHGPAGLDIGAETPEEIAVSILAEMQAVLARRRGSSLRDREAPIHDPVDHHSLPAP